MRHKLGTHTHTICVLNNKLQISFICFQDFGSEVDTTLSETDISEETCHRLEADESKYIKDGLLQTYPTYQLVAQLNTSQRKTNGCHVYKNTAMHASYLPKDKLLQNGVESYKSDKVDTQGSDFPVHKVSHCEVQSHQCGICKKVFTQSSNLSPQKLKPSDVKYQCDECQNDFTQLRSTPKRKLIQSGVKTFKCDECDKAFASANNLYAHKMFHSTGRFQCDVCSKTFKSSSYLAIHILTHSGVNPFSD